MAKENNSLAWVDPALAVEPEATDAGKLFEPAGDTKCNTCGRVSPFKDIYFDTCRHCVATAHPELKR